MLEPHQLVAEEQVLREKSKKLFEFMRTDTYHDLPKAEQDDLLEQYIIMQSLNRVLLRRIKRFSPLPSPTETV